MPDLTSSPDRVTAPTYVDPDWLRTRPIHEIRKVRRLVKEGKAILRRPPESEGAPLGISGGPAIDRVAVYVDLSNVERFYAEQKHRIDYGALFQNLVRGRQVDVGRLFVSYSPVERRAPFYHAIARNSGYDLVRIPFRPELGTERGVDVAIGVDMVRDALSEPYDAFILVCGDGDLVPAAEFVKRCGRRLEVAAVKGSVRGAGTLSFRLEELADEFHDIEAWRQATESNGGSGLA